MQVRLFGTLRLTVPSGRVEVAAGPTVAAVLEALVAQVPPLREQILEPGAMALLPHVNIMLSGRLVRDLQGLETPVQEGDSVAIFPPAAGG